VSGPRNWLKTILLVEDNPNDVELTLEAIAAYRIANEVVVLHDGAEPSTTGAKAPQRMSAGRRRWCSWTSRCLRW
jgi:hypothetical protein